MSFRYLFPVSQFRVAPFCIASSSRAAVIRIVVVSLLGFASASAAPTTPAVKAAAKPSSSASPKPSATPKVSTPKVTPKPSPVLTPTATSAASLTPAPSATTSTPSAEVAVTVNGEEIFKKDVERLLSAARDRDETMQGDSDAAKKKVTAVREQILTDRIELVLWTQEAKRRKIVTPAGDVDKIMAQNKTAFRTKEAWVSFLGGRSEAEYRRTIAQQMAMEELFARLTSDIKVSDDEIKTYFDAHPDQFKVPAMVRVHHIFFMLDKDADTKESERVMSMANEVLKKAQAPNANFEALARENSQANDVMDDSGGLPLFWRDRIPLPKEFQDAAFSGEVGQIVGPIRTSMGVHIIKIDEKIPVSPAPLSFDLKNTIRLALKTQKNDEWLKQTLKDLKDKADIQRK